MSKNREAFSLVEMLIAVILITLLIGLAIFGLKYQLMAIHKTKKIGINKVIKYNQLISSIESMKYYIVDDYDTLNYPMKNLHPYFNGTSSEISFITENPLFSRDIVLVQLKCEENKLLYREEKLYENMDFLRPQLKEQIPEKTFYKDLDKCSFRYILQNKEYEILQDKIPSSVIINLYKNNDINKIYINIKSDYNQSVRIINNAVYPVE